MEKIINNNILKLYNWMKFFNPTEATPLEVIFNEDLWECIIYLPKIDKIISSEGEDSYKVQCDVANQACELIGQYLLEHPELEYKTTISFDTHNLVRMGDGTIIPVPKLKAQNAYSDRCKKQHELIQNFIKAYRETSHDDSGMVFQVLTGSAVALESEGGEMPKMLINNLLDIYDVDVSKIDVIFEEDVCVVCAKVLNQKERF